MGINNWLDYPLCEPSEGKWDEGDVTEWDDFVSDRVRGTWEDYKRHVETTMPPQRRHLMLHTGHCAFCPPDERRFVTPDLIRVAGGLVGEPTRLRPCRYVDTLASRWRLSRPQGARHLAHVHHLPRRLGRLQQLHAPVEHVHATGRQAPRPTPRPRRRRQAEARRVPAVVRDAYDGAVARG